MSETNTNPDEIKRIREETKDILIGMQEILREKKMGKKPTEYSPRSGFYYSEKEAKNLVPIIDDMMVDKETVMIRYDDYPQWAPHTVYLKINQALKYIVDYLDTPDKKYAKFRDCIKISKDDEGQGVVIRYIDNILYQTRGWIAHKIKPGDMEIATYKKKVFDFMESSDVGDEIDLKDLNLTQEEVDQLKSILDESPIFLAFVSDKRVKIVHASHSEVKGEEPNENPTT